MQSGARPFTRHSKAFIASLLACLVLLLDGLAVSPQLHESLHHDAGNSQHQCAITIFQHGQVDAASAETQPAIALIPIELSFVSFVSAFTPAIEHLPAGRAPPVSSFNS